MMLFIRAVVAMNESPHTMAMIHRFLSLSPSRIEKSAGGAEGAFVVACSDFEDGNSLGRPTTVNQTSGIAASVT